jgi:hypothetical protein
MIYADLDVHIVANVLAQSFLPHLPAHTIPQKNRVISADHSANVAAESHARAENLLCKDVISILPLAAAQQAEQAERANHVG